MDLKLLFVVALFAVCYADSRERYRAPSQNRYDAPPQQGYGEPQHSDEDNYGPPEYKFEWGVKDDYSGNDFGHQEERDGDNTKGFYYVQLPDSRRQKVTYYVNGDSGFVADVTYEGEARYSSEEKDRGYQRRSSDEDKGYRKYN